jgi:hypothetical protein
LAIAEDNMKTKKRNNGAKRATKQPRRRRTEKEVMSNAIDLNSLTLGQFKELQALFGCAVPGAVPTRAGGTALERAVMVTTEHRGIFFGYATDTTGDTIRLKRARNCIYWTVEEKGFLGLAGAGPGNGCKIGPPVAELELRKVTSVTEVSPEAVKAWESAPFAKGFV